MIANIKARELEGRSDVQVKQFDHSRWIDVIAAAWDRRYRCVYVFTPDGKMSFDENQELKVQFEEEG